MYNQLFYLQSIVQVIGSKGQILPKKDQKMHCCKGLIFRKYCDTDTKKVNDEVPQSFPPQQLTFIHQALNNKNV